jgi:Immunoglobulin domain
MNMFYKSGVASFRRIAAGLAFLSFIAVAEANPYASGITNTSGTISFILNESAGSLTVTLTNNGTGHSAILLGTGATSTSTTVGTNAGVQSFSLTQNSVTYSNYVVSVSKTGSGAPNLIASVARSNARGVVVNKNPKSPYFGHVYSVQANAGLFDNNSDLSPIHGSVQTAGVTWQASGPADSPYRISVAADDYVMAGDASTNANAAAVWRINPTLQTSQLFLGPQGEAAGLAAGVHGTIQSRPLLTGTIAGGNAVLYQVDGDLQPPGQTNYNYLMIYNIAGGGLPWETPPSTYGPQIGVGVNSVGLGNTSGSTANSYPGLTQGPNGYFYASTYRLNLSNPNIQVYDATATHLLWSSWITNGNTVTGDYFVNEATGGGATSGVADASISPDGTFLVAAALDNHFSIVSVTNGIPDISTLHTVVPTSFSGSARGLDMDAADNIYLSSTGIGAIQEWSPGQTTTTITSNDSTTTNGTFQLIFPALAPTITTQPQDQSVVLGSTATFNVAAVGGVPLSYQWQFGGVNLTNGGQITGSQSVSLNVSTVFSGNGGNYQVIVTNANGSITSTVARLTVAPLPVGWSQFGGSPGPNNVRHDDIYFTDPTNGWASQDTWIYRTTNGGVTWTTNLTNGGAHFRSLGFATSKIGFAGNLGVGSYDNAVTDTNVLYATRDGGVTWSNVDGFAEAGMKGLCSIFVLDSQHIFGGGRVRGPAFVIRSADGGNTWTTVNLTAMGVMNGIMDIYFKDPTNGWVVGMDTNSYSSPPYYGRIAKTTDGGNTWTTVVTAPVASSYFWKMAWPSTNIGYVSLQQNAAFNNVIFYKTTDGGNTWVSNGIPLASVGLTTSQFYLQGIGFVSTNEGWIGGASGLSSYTNSFLHTTDGGVTWTSAGFNDTFLINRIRFLNPNLGFAAGGNLYVYNMPLVITQQPQSQVVQVGTNVNLSVTASSLTPITYQWQKNGYNITATNALLTFTNVTRVVEGTYSVVVANSATNLVSSNAVVRVLASERLSAPVLLPGGQLQLLFADADGGALLTTNDIPSFEVLVSTNLVDWTVLTNALSVTNGQILLQDSWTNAPKRFYRVLEH